ncbi:MAG: O-antigen ligase family protein [Nostoc sp.]|uniref:O-antigen ligase family protein n=1 Tax=Nostoc sp. TaxID=1180 RepID=UPI002FF8652F
MKKFLISAEKLFTIICLMIYSGTPLDPLISNGFTIKEGDKFIGRFLFTCTYIFSISLITLRWKKVAHIFSKDKLIWLLLGVCALSSFWSLDSDTTIRRALGLAGTMLFGLYLASRYTLKEQLKLCAYVLGISAVMCFLFGLLIPQYGIAGGVDTGSWRGIYAQKNILGTRFVLGGAIFFFLAMTNRENLRVLWLGYFSSGLLILLSKSATSLGNFMIIPVTFFIYSRVLHLKYKVMIPIVTLMTIVGIGLYTLFVSQADTILGTVGKDTTLTGRSELWPAVLDMIAKKPWLGYGYAAFWQGNSEASVIVQTVQWNAPNAHNGFLDVLLDLGVLGISIFIIGFVLNFLRGIYLIRWNQTDESLWLLIYLTYVILANLTESTLLNQNSLEWILYVSAILSSKASTSKNLSKYNS